MKNQLLKVIADQVQMIVIFLNLFLQKIENLKLIKSNQIIEEENDLLKN